MGPRLVVALACFAGTFAVPRWSAAASTILYSAFARTRITFPEPNTLNWEQYVPPGSQPATAGTLTLFGRSGPGNPCPDPTAVDYLCWRAYAAAEGATLHAAARVTRKNTTGPVSDITVGHAMIEYDQMNVVSAAVPVVSGVVYLGLGGGATATGSSTVIARADVYVNGTVLECLGGVCEPFQIPSFDGSYLSIELQANASIGEPDQVAVDANADADYVDTLTVQAIELRDASDQKIPDAVVTLTDQSNNVTFTFPNAVQATTTSTTNPGATTTVPGGSTTTTTVAGCEAAATYASIECRLAALTVLVQGRAGKLAPKLGKLLAKATGGVQKAARPGSPERTAAKGLRKAAHALQTYDKVLGSKKATNTLDDTTRTSLRAAGAAIATDVATLQQALTTHGA